MSRRRRSWWSRSAFPRSGDTEQRAFSFVHGLVKPGMECLRRELMARDEILNLHSSLLEQDNDLDMLLSISGGSPDTKPEVRDVSRPSSPAPPSIFKVGLAALIVPEKGIALVQASPRPRLDTSFLAKAHRHLLSMAQMRRRPPSSTAWCCGLGGMNCLPRDGLPGAARRRAHHGRAGAVSGRIRTGIHPHYAPRSPSCWRAAWPRSSDTATTRSPAC